MQLHLIQIMDQYLVIKFLMEMKNIIMIFLLHLIQISINQTFINFSYSYFHRDYLEGTQKAVSVLAGTHNFLTVEIEVFTNIFL